MDRAELDDFVKAHLGADFDDVTAVRCPNGITRQVGSSSACEVTSNDGIVTVVDASVARSTAGGLTIGLSYTPPGP